MLFGKMSDNFRWYIEHSEELHKQYKDQHVAIWKKKVCGHGKTSKEAYDMCKKEYPDSEPTLAYIGDMGFI